ncbi:MAG: protein translocase subunit SecD [Dehalococcoidia bacterium]|nr:protein translocase subunit SecD [Dehalococcoidia bacterium]
MRSRSTVFLFASIVAVAVFCIVIVWPSTPSRYLPGNFWPEGKGFSVGGYERETLRLGLDLQGGAHLVLEANPPAGYQGDLDSALEVVKTVIERRINEFGVAESQVSLSSNHRLEVQLPGISLEEAERLIGRTASLQYFIFNENGEIEPATGNINGQSVAMTGEHLKNNTFPERIGTTFQVVFETTETGSKILRQITANALNFEINDQRRRMVILLDGELISNAVIQGVISDVGVITGLESFTIASELSKQLNAGALPIPLKTIQANEVSATLGDDSVKKSVNAAEIGLLAVLAFMILAYRLPGVLASVALLVYVALTLAVFKLWPVTITLSGIAAFILSVGMAVDANILIFERLREELKKGRPLSSAVETGFKRAWPSIRDSNISTLITCFILFWFGEQFGASFVRGFSITLAIGVLISMFSAIIVTRTFLRMIVGTRLGNSLSLFNISSSTDGQRDKQRQWLEFSKRRWLTMGLSAAILISAIVILLIPPRLNPGIEFTGGSTFTLEFGSEIEQSELRTALTEIGYEGAQIQGTGTSSYLIRTRELEGSPPITGDVGPLPPGEIDTIMRDLEIRFGEVKRLDYATISGSVSQEIARDASIAVGVAALVILIYISFAFRGVRRSWRFGACAVIALIHDALFVLGLFSLLAKVSGTEVDTAFIVAMLTVIGFSVHDSIVVFDRVRDVLTRSPNTPFATVIDVSLTESLVRSINTSFVTLLTIIAMFLIGGSTINVFLLVMLAGVVVGTYSSIGLAAQILVAWEQKDLSKFYRKIRTELKGTPANS